MRTHPKQLFGRQRAVAKNIIVFFNSNELLSPKVLDLDGCFSREKPPSGGCLKSVF